MHLVPILFLILRWYFPKMCSVNRAYTLIFQISLWLCWQSRPGCCPSIPRRTTGTIITICCLLSSEHNSLEATISLIYSLLPGKKKCLFLTCLSLQVVWKLERVGIKYSVGDWILFAAVRIGGGWTKLPPKCCPIILNLWIIHIYNYLQRGIWVSSISFLIFCIWPLIHLGGNCLTEGMKWHYFNKSCRRAKFKPKRSSMMFKVAGLAHGGA